MDNLEKYQVKFRKAFVITDFVAGVGDIKTADAAGSTQERMKQPMARYAAGMLSC